MHLPDPAAVRVDPALILAFEDRRERSAHALAATVARLADQRAATEAQLRAAVLAYGATSRHPVGRLVLDVASPRTAA